MFTSSFHLFLQLAGTDLTLYCVDINSRYVWWQYHSSFMWFCTSRGLRWFRTLQASGQIQFTLGQQYMLFCAIHVVNNDKGECGSQHFITKWG